MCFILLHFDEVSRSASFEEMGRTNVELGTQQIYHYCISYYNTRAALIPCCY